MRKVAYLSYSSFKLFESDPETFYKRYIQDNRPPRDPQNYYMAVGSAFDAFIKADLHKRFVNDGDPAYNRDALFEAQVEPQERDRAKVSGEEVYKRYHEVGAYKDLCEDMRGCINPRFEVDLTNEISLSRLEGGMVILGKPDVMYISRTGARVIHDFKCQGFYSKAPKVPNAGYIKIMPDFTMHKNCALRQHKGMEINGNAPLHMYCEDWATQLSMYAWVLGEPVGSDYILSVDQICCNSKTRKHRVAKHAGICTDEWQNKLFDRLHRCWTACQNGHIFTHLPYEESLARQQAISAEAPPQEYLDMIER